MQVGNVTFEIDGDDLSIAFARLVETADQSIDDKGGFESFFPKMHEIGAQRDLDHAPRQLVERLKLDVAEPGVPGQSGNHRLDERFLIHGELPNAIGLNIGHF